MSGWGERIIPMSPGLVCTSRLAATTGPPDGVLRGPLAQGGPNRTWRGQIRWLGRSSGATDMIMMEMPFKHRYLRKKNMFTPRMGSLKFNAFQWLVPILNSISTCTFWQFVVLLDGLSKLVETADCPYDLPIINGDSPIRKTVKFTGTRQF